MLIKFLKLVFNVALFISLIVLSVHMIQGNKTAMYVLIIFSVVNAFGHYIESQNNEEK